MIWLLTFPRFEDLEADIRALKQRLEATTAQGCRETLPSVVPQSMARMEGHYSGNQMRETPTSQQTFHPEKVGTILTSGNRPKQHSALSFHEEVFKGHASVEHSKSASLSTAYLGAPVTAVSALLSGSPPAVDSGSSTHDPNSASWAAEERHDCQSPFEMASSQPARTADLITRIFTNESLPRSLFAL